ncbi:DUF4870 domain-containing protein [Ignavibacteria bacterium CHB1]|nr:MAG: DUF4870 domain-containing protein [Chlorobiota bacterium]MBV6397692.1 hypothetical protein [Ignavibacteria bacterium]MCC6885472.1 DUF4870 domain-containing protein [Ignavibacteriales bacterium]MCE7952824.1 DUF4870 domain-containing protein [Chlorobi bacterium CHB7]MDL1887009.1 DUF4870 domain-containing protein [Ignavibacteria bacterium CHB1]RIK49586.1 MAG: hypothetical protein DCC60_02770 [Ignavibacteriota bacterium]
MNTVNINQTIIDDNEKLLALLSHLGSMFGGILLPLIIWAVQKDKSQFVRFHSLQAIFFQLLFIVVVVIIVVIVAVIYLAFIFTYGLSNPDTSGLFFPNIIIGVVMYSSIFFSIFILYGYSIYLAVKSYKGEYTKYPIIGNIIYKRVFGEY